MTGCGPYKYIPENKKHLNKVNIKIDKKSSLKEELYQKISPKPNKRFLGIKFHMFLYDLSKPGRENWWHNWLRKIGEEPVVWDSYQSQKTIERFGILLQHNGYFKASITDSIELVGKKQRKVNITYYVSPGIAYHIKEFNLNIQDTALLSLVEKDSINSLIIVGDQYNVSNLIAEKQRLKTLFLNYGYFDFDEEDLVSFIGYDVDTSLNNNVGITLNIENPENKDRHEKYRINNVYIFRNYNPSENLNDPEYLFRNVDTLLFEDIYFLSKGNVKIKPGILTQSNYITPGELFNQQNESLTMKHLRSLRIFQNVEIDFESFTDSINNNNARLLNTHIRLTPMLRQFMQYDIAVINSSVSDGSATSFIGDIGAEASIKYQYKNLFGNAEVLDVTLRGVAESLFYKDSTSENSRRFNATSVGLESRLNIPKFLVPFKSENFIKKYSPQTSLALSYKYFLRDSAYLQNSAKLSFGYNWRGNRFTRHFLDLVNLNYVSVTEYSRFDEFVGGKSALEAESFQDKMISSLQYSFDYNSEGRSKSRDFVYFRTGLELGGNLLIGAYQIFNQPKNNGFYEIFNVPISQFVRFDFDFRYYDQKLNNQTVVYRVFLGFTKPFGNSESVPFEKKYFIGGPNSIRAWNPYYLGPGTSSEPVRNRLTGSSDLKLEFNVEYRFDIFWKLNGAVFLDGGNIWSLRTNWNEDNDLQKEIAFNLSDLRTELALGTGFGFRFDFDYFILRFDWGLKLHNPAGFIVQNEQGDVIAEYKWLFDKGKIEKEDWQIQMGVTYPF